MLDLYLAVGHGVEPNGVFDPGAVAADGTQEHTLCTAVCTAAAAALGRAGISFQWESNAGAGHDLDYRGSVDRVNALNPSIAVEVHFDANNAARGGFGIYLSDAGKRLAGNITQNFKDAGLPTRTDYKDVRGLYFLRGTNCPAVIYECDRTMAQPDLHVLVLMGEAIARGITQFLGVSPAPTPSEGIPMQPDFRIRILGDVVSDYSPPGGGLFQLTDLGFVYAWGNAQYAGSPQEPSAQPLINWSAGGRAGTAVKIEASPMQGKTYRIWDAAGEYYDFPL